MRYYVNKNSWLFCHFLCAMPTYICMYVRHLSRCIYPTRIYIYTLQTTIQTDSSTFMSIEHITFYIAISYQPNRDLI